MVLHDAYLTPSRLDALRNARRCSVVNVATLGWLDAGGGGGGGGVAPVPPVPGQGGGLVGTDDARIVIFTSGTTGHPKGVLLPYRAYECNRASFEQFLGFQP